jgi:uncharacterized protein (UPF0147 family)
MTEFESIIELLEELQKEGVPKNLKLFVSEVISELKTTKEEKSIKINKALAILDEIANDAKISSDLRTQFWNVSSILESMTAELQ